MTVAFDEVDGQRIVTFGKGPRKIIAMHGVSAVSMCWATIGRRLPDDWSLIAIDLRGRGQSDSLPGPYGLDRHAEDVLRIADRVGAGPDAVLTGHSMGAYVAVLVAAQREFAKVVLVDGGIPFAPLPKGQDPDTATQALLGPALERLRQTYASPEEYVAFFKAHPAFAGKWTDDVEAYVRYDLTGPEGALRSRAVGEAVLEDGRWLFAERDRIAADLERVSTPMTLLRAPRGLLDQPVGMLPDYLVRPWVDRLPTLHDEVVPDCNHYTILFDERCADIVAERLTS
ncbi:alpha/beta fold hydrolase [Nonomuraea sp. NPDC049309]|uniref:alpha/beta fold hydrolase n=1 Tax=Nonomuraea sp. NPDC049309 TaxID=3364350 RepID=UPI0037215F58